MYTFYINLLTLIVKAVRFYKINNVKLVWFLGNHARYSEVEPLCVPLRVQVWRHPDLIFSWTTESEKKEIVILT